MFSASPVSCPGLQSDVKIAGLHGKSGFAAAPKRAPDPPARGFSPPLEERKRLLVVDDELAILKLVTRILATDNYEISSADSGEAAAELISRTDYSGVDLLVTDLLMPGMNGRELADIVRARFPTARVLYVTGFADTLFTGLQELGNGESFVEKPFGTDGLLEATRLLMFGHISDGAEPHDKREETTEWSDTRLRARIVKLLRRWRMA